MTDGERPRVFGFEERALVEGRRVVVIGQLGSGPNGLELAGTGSLPSTVIEAGEAGLGP